MFIKKISRIAYQIYEDNYLEKEIIVVGIAEKGYKLAEKIAGILKNISKMDVTLTSIKIDKDAPMNSTPECNLTEEQVKDKVLILVDDVLNSGKTLIHGVKYLIDFPLKRMSTAVLVDRNHKRYPIGTHYVGLTLSTTLKDHIMVDFGKKETNAYLT